MKYVKTLLILITGIALLNSCSKEYSLESNGIEIPSGNWEFKDSTTDYFGTMDTAYIAGNASSKELHLTGKSNSGSETFSIVLFADAIKVGTYKTSLFQATFTYFGSGIIYQANQSTGELIVNITSINTNLVTGTFSGMALDSADVLRKIFNGKFKSTFEGGNSGPISAGVLGDSAGNCKPIVLNGIYREGITTSTSNTAQIEVTVAAAGSYSITTNSVNGITFSGKGIFLNTGVQNVILTATGTPALPGDQNFTVKYGNSQCGFTVNFLPAATTDYYPLTINNTWTYGIVNGTVSDSFSLKVISNSKSINGTIYSDLAAYDVPPTDAYDSSYLRKDNGNYYNYLDYSDFFFFDEPTYSETIILKDNVPAGATWNSPTVTGDIGGNPVTGSLKFTILEKAVPVTLGIYNLPDVIKVKTEAIVGGVVVGSGEFWYARNVGLVYTIQNGAPAIQIGRWINF